MTDRELFLRALAQDEDDVSTRLVYSDWLDEQGEAEEADRQRQWPAAKEWLVRFLRDRTDIQPGRFSYEDLIEVGRLAIANDDATIYLDDEMLDLASPIVKNLREFGQRWSIVTGVALPPDLEEKSYYWRCCANEEYRIAGPEPRQEDAERSTQDEMLDASDDLERVQDDLERERRKRKP